MLKEFKDFAMRGNVVDMAVGIVIGSAFGVIVKSLVDDILMPVIGYILGKRDFADLFITLKSGAVPGPYESLALAKEAGAVTINYGLFFNAITSFIIIAFALFVVIRVMNRLKKEEESPPQEPTTKECPYCFTEIPIKAMRCPHCTSEL
ncbi:MAG: large-conductance mechanosensitive channel protein MscL [Anaerolineales bacterium]|nr:large-conductance mechanosensitive channel protein MscL [Chloroflexota bacterium]MBL6982291.1 large-conductance mechanosensitive channel protein MscL [Anaerolineales bacterium]